MKLQLQASRMKRLLHLEKKCHSIFRCYSDQKMEVKPQSGSLYSQLRAKIMATGPMTVAQYMKEVLINPTAGYYMTRDVFGKSGDFTTSPEISQLFGEMIAVWFVNEWSNICKPKPAQLIELGPGRGTMMDDMLRVFQKLNASDDLSVHLVEVSDALSELQASKLCIGKPFEHNNLRYYKEGVTRHGVKVYWYRSLYDIEIVHYPLIIAHEFFDALPVHKFQKTDRGWRELLIDIDREADSGGSEKFRYVLSREETPATKILIPKSETRDHIEVSPDGLLYMQHIGNHFEKQGGLGLIIDYGHCGTKTDTFRAFRNHSQCDPLSQPGLSDLTADVDFSSLKTASDKLLSFGPVTQREFLSRMQIVVRFQMLLRSCKDDKLKKELKSGFKTLMDEDKMGNCFHFFSIFPSYLADHYKRHPVYGFSDYHW